MKKFLLSGSANWSDPTMILTFALLIGLVVMFVVSAKRRKAMRIQVEKMIDELRPGQRVRTVGGIVGRIKEIREETPAYKTEKGVQVPAVKTVLLQTGNDRFPSFFLIDVQAIYGVIPEEGHSVEGVPVIKSSENSEVKVSENEVKVLKKTEQSVAEKKQSDNESNSDFDARVYVEKRNSSTSKKK